MSYDVNNQQQYGADVTVSPPKDWLTTLLLTIFLGGLGVGRFYSGNILFGILQLVTFGGFGIWTIIDIVLIATNNYHDGQGRLLVHKN